MILTDIAEPVTDRAKRVLALAAQEAKRRGRRMVRPEHILLAILQEGGGVACAVLRQLEADPGALSQRLTARLDADLPIAQSDAENLSDQPPPGLLRTAAAEARTLGHRYVGTEHLLIAIAHEPRGLAGEALAAHGVTPATASAMTARLLGQQVV